jgi:hypothetical protein
VCVTPIKRTFYHFLGLTSLLFLSPVHSPIWQALAMRPAFSLITSSTASWRLRDRCAQDFSAHSPERNFGKSTSSPDWSCYLLRKRCIDRFSNSGPELSSIARCWRPCQMWVVSRQLWGNPWPKSSAMVISVVNESSSWLHMLKSEHPQSLSLCYDDHSCC